MAGEAAAAVAEWTTDRLLGGRLVLRQPAAGYRVAIDTVLLAAAVPAGAGDRLVELGAGVGGAALAVAARVPAARIVAVEREPALARTLAENARRNRLADAVRAVVADIAALPLAPHGADAVFLNPPFAAADGAGSAPRTELGRRARHEGEGGLAAWLAAAARLVRRGGDVVLVHRADRLAAVLAGLAPAAVVVMPLWPRAGRPAKRVLVRATIGRRGGVRLLPGLVLHGAASQFTAEADAVLRGMAALHWE